MKYSVTFDALVCGAVEVMAGSTAAIKSCARVVGTADECLVFRSRICSDNLWIRFERIVIVCH